MRGYKNSTKRNSSQHIDLVSNEKFFAFYSLVLIVLTLVRFFSFFFQGFIGEFVKSNP